MSVRTRLLDLLRLFTRKKAPIAFADWFRVEPVARGFGAERGISIARYYVESFLKANSETIRGCVLEVAESSYTTRFGGDRVTRAEVLHVDRGECPGATIVGDLTQSDALPENVADCFICTQTLQFIPDLEAALVGARQLLRPEGVLLATISGISQISRYDMDRWGEYWRLTKPCAERLFGRVFGADVSVVAYGNCLAATALLQGVVVEDLPDPALLDQYDDDYQVLIGVVARKGGDS